MVGGPLVDREIVAHLRADPLPRRRLRGGVLGEFVEESRMVLIIFPEFVIAEGGGVSPSLASKAESKIFPAFSRI